MVGRIVPFGVVSVALLAACGAVCQTAARPLPDAPFPDAPSAQIKTAAPEVKSDINDVFGREVRSPLKLEAVGRSSALIRQLEFAAPGNITSSQRDSNTFLSKYFSPSQQKKGDQSSSDGSFMARATHAAAGIFVTRDDSGKGRVNTSYFLRALTSVAADTASRPYWRRSPGEPLSDFGSTVGNDAGMNLLHEFEPGLQHLVKSHAPRFVARMAARMGHN
jgi:hypothetical protein